MINAVLYREGDFLTGCRLKGHSGQDEYGKDIVCAGVSILTCSCVNTLEHVYGVVPRMNEENPEKGLLDFDLPDEMTEEENGQAQIVMSVLRQGLEDLSAEYPQFVTLSIKERRKQP